MQQIASKHVSFEFFPPKNAEKAEELKAVSHALNQYKPDCFTVTFGAGGSTREKTIETVTMVRGHTNTDTAAHISCIGATKKSMEDYLHHLKNTHKIKQLVTLRGDIPSGMQDYGEFHYASELISFIRQTTGDYFQIAVAAYPEYHPQCLSADDDFNCFKHKVNLGADLAYTQYFYSPEAYFYFQDKCLANNIDIPIIPGIMPITQYKQLARFSDACGAEIPRWIRQKLQHYDQQDDLQSLKAFGVEVISRLCQRLLDQGAPGLHFYSMNRVSPLDAILHNLRVS